MNSILLIEDDRLDAEIVRRCLIGSEYSAYQLVQVGSISEALEWLSGNAAKIILVDLNLPDKTGLECYRLVQEAAPQAPVVVLTGTANESIATTAISEGAQDYLCKSDLNRRLLTRCIGYSIQRSQMQSELRFLAYHDELTGLTNRSNFNDIIQRTIEASQRSGDQFAVLYIDLDDFKMVNDCLGHAAGDELLIAISERLKAAVEKGDTVSRFGGDEFIVLLKNATTVAETEGYINRIQTEFSAPIFISGTEIHVTASIGAVLVGTKHENVECIIRDADTAMYHAKALGKARYAVFDQAMHKKVREKLMFSAEVRKALENREFELHYQPILSLANDEIIGFESLLRWPHPTRGMLRPDQFLHLLDGTQSTSLLGRFVLEESCLQMKRWRDSIPELKNARVCVNITPAHFSTEQLFEEIAEALETSGLPANGLELEITEEGYVENIESAISTAKRLKESNIGLAIDDFGTGYSSLSQLARFPFDTLKIDREFVHTLGEDPEYGSLFISTIANLADALNVRVIAEGIEYQWQKHKLNELNCHYGQGYLFARPMPPKEIQAWIAKMANPYQSVAPSQVM